MILERERNEPKRTYRQAECCKESHSKECLHCRCCQKMKNWRQLHVGLIYSQNICHRHQWILLTKQYTSDKHDVDSSRLDFNISKMTRGFVLRNIQTALRMILIFNYVSFYCQIADKCNWYSFQERALWVWNPNHSDLQYQKFPSHLLQDELIY